MLYFTALFTLCVFSYATYSYRQQSPPPPSPLHCNDSLCGSIVSECLRTDSCRCALDTVNDTCCKECVRCLGAQYYEDCCSCFACAKCRRSLRTLPRLQSHVEEFTGMPELFNALTAAQPHACRVYSFELPPERTQLYGDALKSQQAETHNCTVIYLDMCVSWNKCRQRCGAFGASSYRWFHDGCCECVGAQCLDYGLNESRCRYCPEQFDASEEDADCGEEESGQCAGNTDD